MILTKALWLGIAAASLIFLAAYGGMVSLAQVGIYGVAGMTYANLVLADGGAAAAWNPYVALVVALVVATVVGLGFGWIAARSEGIYFLMITLAVQRARLLLLLAGHAGSRASAASTASICRASSAARRAIRCRATS